MKTNKYISWSMLTIPLTFYCCVVLVMSTDTHPFGSRALYTVTVCTIYAHFKDKVVALTLKNCCCVWAALRFWVHWTWKSISRVKWIISGMLPSEVTLIRPDTDFFKLKLACFYSAVTFTQAVTDFTQKHVQKNEKLTFVVQLKMFLCGGKRQTCHFCKTDTTSAAK